MKTAICTLSSASPYAQSKYIDEAKTKNETHREFEERIWRERAHINTGGNMFIPPGAFKNCIAEAAKYKSIQIPGKGKATYTKHFEAGILVLEPLVLPVNKGDIEPFRHHVPSDGRRGGTKRVMKLFPMVPSWGGVVTYTILDDLINEEVFTEHLVDAGQFIGIGAFRPRNNGWWGRFNVDDLAWKEN